jgi:hypothetical protein
MAHDHFYSIKQVMATLEADKREKEAGNMV